MTAKHTPEPWKYGVRPDGSIWLSLGDHKTGAHHQGDLVATEEDARLIVAAPQMLRALIRVSQVFPTDTDMAEAGWTGEEITAACAVYDFARAAIAKATASTADAGVVG